MTALTPTMMWALKWLNSGNEFAISLIERHGYSAEMPRRNTMQALADRQLVDIIEGLGTFEVKINDRGRAAAEGREIPPPPLDPYLERILRGR